LIKIYGEDESFTFVKRKSIFGFLFSERGETMKLRILLEEVSDVEQTKINEVIKNARTVAACEVHKVNDKIREVCFSTHPIFGHLDETTDKYFERIAGIIFRAVMS